MGNIRRVLPYKSCLGFIPCDLRMGIFVARSTTPRYKKQILTASYLGQMHQLAGNVSIR